VRLFNHQVAVAAILILVRRYAKVPHDKLHFINSFWASIVGKQLSSFEESNR